MDKDRQFVTSLDRGLQVLRAFSRKSGGLSNGQLAKQTKLAPSTISRLVYTLRELGYITYDRATRSYILTPQVLTLGYPVLTQAPLLHQVRPILVQIAQQTGETCGFAQRDGLYATFLDCQPVAPFDQRLSEALASPVVVVRDTWHKGIGGIAVPVSNGSEVGAITVPVSTSNVTDKEMRGTLSAKILELAERCQFVRGTP
jgi:DNA-binding IclR family transcriptional regulator